MELTTLITEHIKLGAEMLVELKHETKPKIGNHALQRPSPPYECLY